MIASFFTAIDLIGEYDIKLVQPLFPPKYRNNDADIYTPIRKYARRNSLILQPMEHMDDINEHKRRIDALIKDGVDRLLESGEISEQDFYFNEHNERMIKINDQEGVEIVFNYTTGRLYSYGNRLNED